MDVLMYKCPGPYQRAGGTYNYQLAESEADVSAALAAGWFASLPEAIDGVSLIESDAPATRDELELKATELGIEFDGRTTDRKLAAKIADALGA